MRLLYLSVFLAGNASAQLVSVPIDFSNPPPADWPVLDERLTVLDDIESVRRFCNAKVKFKGVQIKGCAVVSFEYQLCMIYVLKGDDAGLEHERAHCKGYVHVGDGDSAYKALDLWKSKRVGLSNPQ
jgi:hypothetical protein